MLTGRERGADGLPVRPVRDAIDDATHRAVAAWAEAEGTRASRFPILYALVGAVTARDLTGGSYVPMVGSMAVQTRHDGDGFDVELVDADPATGGREFHAWFVRSAGGRGELVDLTTRHFPAWAEASGAPWDLPAPPRYLWADVPIGVRLRMAPGFFPGFPGYLSYVSKLPASRAMLEVWGDEPERATLLRRLERDAAATARALLAQVFTDDRPPPIPTARGRRPGVGRGVCVGARRGNPSPIGERGRRWSPLGRPGKGDCGPTDAAGPAQSLTGPTDR
jgi:hypothetical protein